jgi:aryl-alcohol dehydrogenase-like predicted oxidoreductase
MVHPLQRGEQLVHRRATAHDPARSAVSSTFSYVLSTSTTTPPKNEKQNKTTTTTHRYGIRAFDTAPWYDTSETVLGTALRALSPDFPRDSYQLLTKVGRYGPTTADFDYSRDAVRLSVRRSLRRLRTPYLDVVYVHDVEFVASCVAPRAQGNHARALGDEAAAYGLAEEEEEEGGGGGGGKGARGNVRAVGDDERVLEAISALRELQAEGLIRHVGICGPSSLSLPYPLPTTKLHPSDESQACPSPPSSAPPSSSSTAQVVP